MRDYDRQTGWGVVLVVVGLAFLADRVLGIELGEQGWPLIILGIDALPVGLIIAGAWMLAGRVWGRRGA